jgi:hypothetical protein
VKFLKVINVLIYILAIILPFGFLALGVLLTISNVQARNGCEPWLKLPSLAWTHSLSKEAFGKKIGSFT